MSKLCGHDEFSAVAAAAVTAAPGGAAAGGMVRPATIQVAF